MHDLWNDLNTWINRHDQQLDLALLWVLVVGFGILAVVKGTTLWVISRQHDKTRVGRSLKMQKLAETVMFAVLTLLYGAALAIYYQQEGMVLGTWQRMGLRVILAAGILGAVIAGIKFILALQSENWGQASRTIAQDARDVRQDARSDAQDRRDIDWEASHE